MPASYSIEVLGAQHERKGFDSGVPALDRYFREQVTQDVRRLTTTCYVAREAATGRVAGYYTIAAGAFPWPSCRRCPQTAAPLSIGSGRQAGRLAVDQAHRGRGLGGVLLWDAVIRARRSELAVFAVAVDAEDDPAEAFYRHHGFGDWQRAATAFLIAHGHRPAPGAHRRVRAPRGVGGADEQYILWRRPVERWPGRNAVSQPSGHSPVHAFR